jgi:hypothetical protein
MNKRKVLAVSLATVVMVMALFGCSPTLEDQAKEYLTKYDDTFTFVDKKENNGSNTYYFSSQKFPDEGVSVHYEASFEALGREPFSDNYASLMLKEEGLKKGRELMESAFPGADYDICESRGEYVDYFNKDTTFDTYYAAMGAYYGVVIYKTVSEDELKADSEKLKEVLLGEKDAVQMTTAKLGFKIFYYPEDAEKVSLSDYADFEKLSGYDAVLNVEYVKVKDECEIKEMEIVK